jgi:hypothetical protein
MTHQRAVGLHARRALALHFRLLVAAVLALTLIVASLGLAVAREPSRASQQQLSAFAYAIGLRDVWPFVETVMTLRQDGRLPQRYIMKDEARKRGWQGGGLCRILPGRLIGGDVFENRQRRLPLGSDYFEADLDGDCYQRGARRLIYGKDGSIYVTLDHYESFHPVP